MFDDYMYRFRQKMELNAAKSATISDIIARSTSKTEVIINDNENAIPVAFINNDKEGSTESLMYTYAKDGVKLTDYVQFLNDWYLVYDEIKNIKRENYINVFRLILCNITFDVNGSSVKAFFKGSLRSAASEESNLAQNFGVMSLGEAYLILPSSFGLKANQTFKINDKGWRSTFVDNISNAGITYAAIEEYTIVNEDKTSENEVIQPLMMAFEEEPQELLAGITLSFDTEGGYIKANNKINIISKTAALVKFIIPFGTENITIETKQNNKIVSTYYKVRG